jgi:hypothetical protein
MAFHDKFSLHEYVQFYNFHGYEFEHNNFQVPTKFLYSEYKQAHYCYNIAIFRGTLAVATRRNNSIEAPNISNKIIKTEYVSLEVTTLFISQRLIKGDEIEIEYLEPPPSKGEVSTYILLLLMLAVNFRGKEISSLKEIRLFFCLVFKGINLLRKYFAKLKLLCSCGTIKWLNFGINQFNKMEKEENIIIAEALKTNGRLDDVKKIFGKRTFQLPPDFEY